MRKEEKQETIERMTDKFNELSKTSVNTYTLMSELYNVCYQDMLDELEMVDLTLFSERLSAL